MSCKGHKEHYDFSPLPPVPDLSRVERTKGWTVPKLWQSEKKKYSSLPTSWCSWAQSMGRALGTQQTDSSIISSPKTPLRPWEDETVREWNFAQFWNVGHLRGFGTPFTFSHHSQPFLPWTRASGQSTYAMQTRSHAFYMVKYNTFGD